MRNWVRRLEESVLLKAGGNDLIILFVSMGLVMYQPFILVGELNLFELGLYASGIDSEGKEP